ncbi:hypothetical protein R6Z07F_014395 [Ovis aries]
MLDPRPQFDTYAPRQGEVAALRFEAESAGIPGGRGRWRRQRQHWRGGPLGNASSGAGPRALCQSARPTPAPRPGPSPRPAHSDGLKGPHMPVLRGLGAPSIPQGFQGKMLMKGQLGTLYLESQAEGRSDAIRIVLNRSKPAGPQVRGSGTGSPAPAPEHPEPPDAALRRTHPSGAAARTPPRRAPVTRIPARASAAPERPRPPPSLPPVPRPPPRSAASDPPGLWGEEGARPRKPPPPEPGARGRSARATREPEGPRRVGRAHSPLTSAGPEPRGCSKPFETAWAAAHPAVSSLFIGPGRTAHCPSIGSFERTVGTRRPQP